MNITISQQPQFFDSLLGLDNFDAYHYGILNREIIKIMPMVSNLKYNSLLNIQGESWILILQTHSNALLIYGNAWSKNQFDEIRESFDLTMYRNCEIVGDSILIKDLIAFYEIENFQIEKERLFYKTSSVHIFSNNGLSILMPNENDITILAAMLQQYYHEEYKGNNDKAIEDMSLQIENYILKETMYILRNSEGDILSFCTIINPEIGILFTTQKFRNMGYGKIILSYCSNLLLQNNTEIYLTTDKSIVESNAVCQKVGFKQYFEHWHILININ